MLDTRERCELCGELKHLAVMVHSNPEVKDTPVTVKVCASCLNRLIRDGWEFYERDEPEEGYDFA